MQTDSRRRPDSPAEHARQQQSARHGARGVQYALAGLLRARRSVTSADRKATRRTLTDRWPVVSLERRDGLNPLSLQGLRQIADAAVLVLIDRP